MQPLLGDVFRANQQSNRVHSKHRGQHKLSHSETQSRNCHCVRQRQRSSAKRSAGEIEDRAANGALRRNDGLVVRKSVAQEVIVVRLRIIRQQ